MKILSDEGISVNVIEPQATNATVKPVSPFPEELSVMRLTFSRITGVFQFSVESS